MVLIIAVLLLVAGIAFYQAVQGLFSALIMAILTVLCAAVAFEFYESLAGTLYTRQPAHADAGALIALFVIPLLVLRIVIDRFFPGNVVTGTWADRIGGGALGIFTGMIVVGVLAVALQMLPLGPRFLMYRPYNDALQRVQTLAPFYPDDFTVGLMNVLSGGAFGCEPRKSYRHVHDDLLLELFCARNQIEQTREVDLEDRQERIGRMDALPDSLQVLGLYEPNEPDWADDVPRNPLMDKLTGSRIVIVRVAVNESARGTDNWWRLPATHFRLVTREGKLTSGPIRSHYPVAYMTAYEGKQDYSGNVTRSDVPAWKPVPAPLEDTLAQVGKLAVQRGWSSEGPGKLVVDWVYRIGLNDTPAYMVFRRVAVQSLRAAGKDMPDVKDALVRIPKQQRRRRR